MPPARELDMLLTAGERISMALLAMAISDLGVEARSFTGSQARHDHRLARTAPPASSTSRPAGSSRRSTRAPSRSSPASRAWPRTPRTSPPSAAAAPTPRPSPSPPRSTPTSARSTPTSTASSPPTRASCRRPVRSRTSRTRRCSSSPPSARRCCTCAASSTPDGSTCRSTSGRRSPTARERWSCPPKPSKPLSPKEVPWNSRSSPASLRDVNEAKITVVGVPDMPGEAAAIFKALAQASINVDMIVQNVSAASTGRTDISFTCPQGSAPTAMKALDAQRDAIGFESLRVDDQIAQGLARRRGHAHRIRVSRRRSSRPSPTPASTSR